MTMYAGDELHDDDTTSGPATDPDEAPAACTDPACAGCDACGLCHCAGADPCEDPCDECYLERNCDCAGLACSHHATSCSLYEPDEDEGVSDEDLVDPMSGNLVSSNETDWYQDGKLVLTTDPENRDFQLKAFMDRAQFWPEVVTISDHGNVTLITAAIMAAECQHEADEEAGEGFEDSHYDVAFRFPCKYAAIGCPATVSAALDLDDLLPLLRPHLTRDDFFTA